MYINNLNFNVVSFDFLLNQNKNYKTSAMEASVPEAITKHVLAVLKRQPDNQVCDGEERRGERGLSEYSY